VSGFPAERAVRAVRELALALPGAFEDHPFGSDAHVFKVDRRRMFAIMSDGPPVALTVKLTREERQVALELPFVREARYVGRYGWVTAAIGDEHELDCALEWLRESFWLRAPEAVREAAWAM
jgi:predicted DNA-binding protein (MmcQ/YjbR family)